MKTVLFNPLLIFLWIFPFMGNAQYITVSGYVAHLFTGNPVENVNIFETQSGIGTITDKEGFFKLILKQGNLDISFALNGYKPVVEKFTAKNDTTLSLVLEPLKRVNNVQDKDESVHKADEDKKNTSQRKRFLFL
jgi:hypothetical protein